MLALGVFGIFALTLLNTDEFPDVQNPVVVVSVPYPGASPESVEREVVDRIEEGIAGISGVDKIQSNSLDGYGVIIAFFQFEKDLQEATQEIRDKISEIRNELPPEMEEPILTRFNPADLPIMSLVLSSHEAEGARADAAGRSRHHPAAARHPRRRRGRSRRRRRARADGGAAAARPAGGRRQRRAGRAGAPGAEPRGAGRAA